LFTHNKHNKKNIFRHTKNEILFLYFVNSRSIMNYWCQLSRCVRRGERENEIQLMQKNILTLTKYNS
jgi:hypothetical protein